MGKEMFYPHEQIECELENLSCTLIYDHNEDKDMAFALHELCLCAAEECYIL